VSEKWEARSKGVYHFIVSPTGDTLRVQRYRFNSWQPPTKIDTDFFAEAATLLREKNMKESSK